MKRNPFLVMLLLLLLPTAARSATCAVSHVFATGETLTAAILNMNPTAEVNCANNIDNQNIGAAGIYATQIVPVTLAQGVFGGSISYTFTYGLNVTGPLFLKSGAGQQKIIRTDVTTGDFQVVNSANTAVIFSISDVGTIKSGTGQVVPTYTAAGTLPATTAHTVVGTCTFAASTACTTYFVGASIFSSVTSYTCYASGATTFINANNIFQIILTTASSSTYAYVCSGT